MSQFSIQITAYSEAAADIQAVRTAVFHQEQGIDPALDFDGYDAACQHILVYANHQPIGTARIRFLTPQLAKIERVAVLADYRGQGIGSQIVQTAVSDLDQKNIAESKVHAQIHATAFYLKLGFKPCGAAFYEAGLPHQEMRRSHPNRSPITTPSRVE
ncbi:MAG: GNAT family N-acetyltransferase [Elainella sp. Prado103]|jgi:predicted GNAT family N-acyltransferase|nr:GNAT family N-acetyltransferase [Elainella sp. Prado103]